MKKEVFLVFGLVSLASVFALIPSIAKAAVTVRAGQTSGKAGSVVEFPITFEPGSATTTSLQFDLVLPPSWSTATVTAGDILNSSGKQVQTGMSGKTWHFVIFGINTTPIPAGTLLTAKVRVARKIEPGTFEIPISNIFYANASGKDRKGNKMNGKVTVIR